MSRDLAFKSKATAYSCPKCGAPVWETYDKNGKVDGYHCFRLKGESHSFAHDKFKSVK